MTYKSYLKEAEEKGRSEGLEQGRSEGLAEGKLEMAKAMKADNEPVDKII